MDNQDKSPQSMAASHATACNVCMPIIPGWKFHQITVARWQKQWKMSALPDASCLPVGHRRPRPHRQLKAPRPSWPPPGHNAAGVTLPGQRCLAGSWVASSPAPACVSHTAAVENHRARTHTPFGGYCPQMEHENRTETTLKELQADSDFIQPIDLSPNILHFEV